MELLKKDDNLSVKPASFSSSSSKRKQIILEEDEFIDALDKIIERDFFPALSKMKKHLKTFDGTVQNVVCDLTGLISQTPATFETPTITNNIVNEMNENQEVIENADTVKNTIKIDLPLNAFLARYTSEDNASFGEIMKEAEKRHQAKYPWLYVPGNEYQKNVALTASTDQMAIESENSQNQLTCYKSLNSLMFVPDGVRVEDQINANKYTKICHENTRFKRNPFNDNINCTLAEAAASNSKDRLGKIGIDGAEMVDDGPKGYLFASLTPSPAPGVSNTPLMTWGEIEGTPYSLEGSETPYVTSGAASGTPHFKIPDAPDREKIGHALADKINRQNRDKKKEAFKQAQYLKNSPLIYSGGKTFSDSLGSMSPAAQRLATNRLGINKNVDKELRGSYSPAISRNTPESRSRSPITPSPSARNPTTPKPPASSLTDGLLNIPLKTTRLN